MSTQIPDMMTAVAVEGGKGPASALHPVRIATPTPAAGEVLIAVRAAGVNRPDLLQRLGFYPPPPGAPSTLGLEVAGEIAAVGDGASRWKVGDRVCALLGGGGYAEYATVDARQVLPIPNGLSWEQAAALPETVFTVFANVWEDGRLEPGETLMVHGATSGIGVTAILMAKAYGAKVIATGRGADKAAAALKLGADVAVDTKTQDFAEVAKANGGADVVLDMVGGDYTAKNLDAMNPGGRSVQIATLGGMTASVDLLLIMRKRLTLTGSTLRARPAEEKGRLAAEIERIVWPWVASGRLSPPIDKTFPLERAADAHAHLEAGEHIGKVVLLTGQAG
ncbi:NAD(P)H-quinone oxidoreductase [soil metagenome]